MPSPAVLGSPGPAPLAPPDPSPEPCVSCGAPAGTPYCPECGERRAADRRYTLRAFAAEAFETVTNADSTLWRTLVTLLRHPGELTRAWMAGVRVPYMKPLQLFLIVNVLYFVWAGWAGERVFDTGLFNHMRNGAFRLEIQRQVVGRLLERWIAYPAYAAAFNAAATLQAKTLIISMVPMFATVLALVQVRRRRPLVQHLVYALHLYTLLLLLSIAQRYLVQWPVIWVSRLADLRLLDGEGIITTAMVSAMGLYVLLSLRRAYGDGWLAALAKTALLTTAIVAVLGLYRTLLFYVTFWTT